MEDIRTIITSIGPGSGQQLIWDLTLYWLFLINIVMLLMESSAFGTNIAIAVLLAVFIDKTFAFGYMFNPDNGIYDDPKTCHAKVFVGTYLIRVIMFAGPFAVAGSTSAGKARGIGILAGLSGVVYMFARWFFEQREVSTTRVTCENTDWVIQSAGLILILAKLVLRDRLLPGAVHRHIPIAVTRHFAADDVEV